MSTNTTLLQQAGAGGAFAGSPATLEPVLQIPLQTSLDGSFVYPRIEFDATGSRVFVQEQTNGGPLATLVWHAPDVAAAAIVVLPLLFVLFLARVLARRQAFGHYYCRKCNYDVTAPGGMPPDEGTSDNPARCPECGTGLIQKRPRLGRSVGARVWKVCGVLVLLWVVSVGALIATLELANAARSWATPWMPWISQIFSLPRLVRLDNHFGDWRQRVSVYSLPDGKRLDRFELEGMAQFACLTRDSKQYVWTTQDPRGGPALKVRDLDSRREREINLSIRGTAHAIQLVPSVRSGHVFIGYHLLQNPMAPTAGYEPVLLDVDLTTGASTPLARPPLVAVDGTYQVGQFLIDERTDNVRWAYLLNSATDRVTRTFSGSIYLESSKWDFNANGLSWYEPTFSTDGLAVDVPGHNLTTATRVNLSDGATSTISLNNKPGTAVTNERVTVAWAPGLTPAQSSLEVRGTDGAVIGLLSAGTASVSTPVASRDLRWIATVTTLEWKNWRQEPRFSGSVGVWDLNELKAAPAQ